MEIVIATRDASLGSRLSAAAHADVPIDWRVTVLDDAALGDAAATAAVMERATVLVADEDVALGYCESFAALRWCHAVSLDASALAARRDSLRVTQAREHRAAAARKQQLEAQLAGWRRQHDEVAASKAALEAEVEAALAMLRSLSARQIAEVQHYVHPPQMARVTLEAVHILLGAPTHYRGLFRQPVSGKQMVKAWPPPWQDILRETRKDTFLPEILHFDPMSVEAIAWVRLASYTSQPEFTPERGRKTSKVIGVLVRWILALSKWVELMEGADGRRNPLLEELERLERANAPALRELAHVDAALQRTAANWSLTAVPTQFFASAASEFALAWLMALEHSVPQLSRHASSSGSMLPPRRLRDLTVVIFGAGRVGRAIAKCLRVAGVRRIYALARHARDASSAAIASIGALSSSAYCAKCIAAADCVINALPVGAAASGALLPHLRTRGASARAPTYIAVGHNVTLLSPRELLDAVRAGLLAAAVVDDVECGLYPSGAPPSGGVVDWSVAAAHDAITVTPSIAGGGRTAALDGAVRSFAMGLKAFTAHDRH